MQVSSAHIPDLTGEWIRFRKELHRYPELSGQENETRGRVRAALSACQPSAFIEIGGTGLAVVFDSGNPGPTLLLRSELDALPIAEINDFAHRSVFPGVAHKCGHDGHTAILVGVGQMLSQHPPVRGKLVLLFQPAEETGQGAAAVLSDPAFAQIEPDWAVALHNIPGHPQGAVLLREGHFTASVCTLIIRITGKTAHAAQPETGSNPIFPMHDILQKARELEQTDATREDFALLTPVHSVVGERAYGTAPGYGEIHFTIRTWEPDRLASILDELRQYARTRAAGQGAKVDFAVEEAFAANINHAEAVNLISEAAQKTGMPIIHLEHPFRWGEDFGLFTDRYPGALIGLGAGEEWPDLHNPDYDFPDAVIAPAVGLLSSIVEKLLH